MLWRKIKPGKGIEKGQWVDGEAGSQDASSDLSGGEVKEGDNVRVDPWMKHRVGRTWVRILPMSTCLLDCELG